MRALTGAGLAMIALGVAAIAAGVIRGEVSFALLVIIPVIYGSGLWALAGGVLIFLGFAVTFFSMMGTPVWRHYGDDFSRESYPGQDDYSRYPGEPWQRTGAEGTGDQRRKSEFGGVIFLGPIPILFGSGRSLRGSKLLTAMMIISAILAVLFILGLLLR